MLKSNHIYYPPSHRKSRHVKHRSYRDNILPKVETKSRSKRFIELTEGEKWRRRHYNCIFPTVEPVVEREPSTLARENGVERTEVSRQEQIKYEPDSWGKISWFKSLNARILFQLFGLQIPSALSASLADTPCVDVDVDSLLKRFKRPYFTSYPFRSSLSCLFKSYIAKCYDFGTVYAHLRQFEIDESTEVALCRCEELDRKMREEALVDKIIISPLLPPRRVWDLFSNRVVPWWVARKTPWAISHAWMDVEDRKLVSTPINGYEWPVPIPKDADLDLIRKEMLHMGAEYVWLDVLCLRQKCEKDEDKRGG